MTRAERERRRIRARQAPFVRELLEAIDEQYRTGTPHQTRRLYGYVEGITNATKKPASPPNEGGRK